MYIRSFYSLFWHKFIFTKCIDSIATMERQKWSISNTDPRCTALAHERQNWIKSKIAKKNNIEENWKPVNIQSLTFRANANPSATIESQIICCFSLATRTLPVATLVATASYVDVAIMGANKYGRNTVTKLILILISVTWLTADARGALFVPSQGS